MPRYEFMCEKCNKPFELTMTMAEHEKGKVRCPECNSTRVAPQLGGFMGRRRRRADDSCRVIRKSMTHHLFDELLGAARRLGVAVRLEPFETAPLRGGGCVSFGARGLC
jgi:putative FmdB family regulatory protein